MANKYASILALAKVFNMAARAEAAGIVDDQPYNWGPTMFILIDTTNRQALARHASARALQALHYIQFANVDAVVVPEGANRGWAQVDGEVITGVLANVGYVGELPAAYNELIKLARKVTEATDWLLLPFTLDELQAQALTIDGNSMQPLRFSAHTEKPEWAEWWSLPPQRLIARSESTFASEFTSAKLGVSPLAPLPPGAASAKVQAPKTTHQAKEPIMATAKKAAAKKAPATKKAAAKKAVAPKPPKGVTAPKPPKAAKAGKGDKTIQAPREGGTTRKVWDVCEALLAKKGECPPFSAVNAKLGETVSLATQRSTYAYWRRAKGYTGRVVA